MVKKEDRGYLLARVNFPLYAVKVISERHILVAGGGGQAKTGISNTFEIYELVYDKVHDNCRANRITHQDTGRRAIMTAAVFDYEKHFVLATGGMDGMCLLHKLSYTTSNGERKNLVPNSRTPSPEELNRERHPSGRGLRRRRTSSMSSHGDENEAGLRRNSLSSGNKVKTETVPGANRSARAKSNGDMNKNGEYEYPNIGFDISEIRSLQADFSVSEDDEPFLKVIRYSRIRNILVTGGADGHLRVWKHPDMKKMLDIHAHKNEVDDLDINPTGTRVVTVSRDGHGYVWNIDKPGKKEEPVELEYNLPVFKNSMKRMKYNIRGCRYGIVEGDCNNYKLFTIMNPVVREKPPNPTYLCKWDTKTYVMEKVVSTGLDALSAMSISDDGRFIGLGTLTGTVKIYIGFNLKLVYEMPMAHNIFVTGVEFLKVCNETQKLTGDKDTSLVSISVDNHIVVHHVPKLGTVGFTSSVMMLTITLFVIYLLMDLLGL